MWIPIDPSNGIPIYDQIVRQAKFSIAHGAIRPGDLIPSVRELAQRLAVNPNTVSRAYRELQSAGFLEPLRGEGLRVAANAVEASQRERVRLLSERLRSAIVECCHSGLTTAEIRSLVGTILHETESITGQSNVASESPPGMDEAAQPQSNP